MKTRITAIVLLVLMLCGAMSLTGCGINVLRDFEDATVGVLRDSSYDQRFSESFKEASFKYYDSYEALVDGLAEGETDCVLLDRTVRDSFRRYDQRLYSAEGLTKTDIALALGQSSSGTALKVELDAYIADAKEDGTLDALNKKWREGTLPADATLVAPTSRDGNRDLKIAVNALNRPLVYKSGESYTGFEIELIYAFCAEQGYGVELVEAEVEDALAGVASGIYDIAAAGISVTDARKETVSFAESHGTVDAVASYYVSGFRSIWDGGFATRLTADSQGTLMVIFVLTVLACAIVGYLLGSVNSAIIISGVLFRDDIRRHGSGNAGMTNMLRTYGTAAAAMTLLGDVLKTVIAVFCGAMICGAGLGGYVAGALCVCGHVFPIYYKFRGGKGVLCAATMIAMLSPWVFLICFGIFLIIVLMTRYVSLGSVIAAGTYPLFLVRIYDNGIGNVFAVLVAVLIIICHRKNLGRLWRGEESKISFKRKGSANSAPAVPEESADSEEGN